MTKFISAWKQYLSYPHRKAEFLITILLLIITLTTFSRFLLFNEARQGAILDDPILSLFNAIDLNALLFFAIYSSLLIALFFFSFDPEVLLTGIQTYILLVMFRMSAMYLIPLDPPVGCIDLQDPVVFVMGTGKKIVKDLFFSGHTSTAFLLFQTAKNKYLKTYFLLATLTVGIAVILQKAHYTIDVYAGLIFSFASYQIVKKIRAKFPLVKNKSA
ncbi:MAG TPA: phosphatase PAP2-related protein [Ignavibacteria bacterium]|nr:phosphatase PAP2-related protein [Ignavibacteria bacterium]HQY51852.1 phosphatase PAP2-related protein [Ignavibacteria bacterium]HRB00355.1 phosphatase PAP2-related protein [Ignavibacteria bacterium]